MAYGTAKIDIVTFTNGGVDQDVSISGIVASTSGNLSVTGTVSGTTFTGVFGQFNTLTAVSGVFTSQISGSTVTGDTGQFITATGTTSSFTSGNFINLSGAVSTVTSGVFASGTASNPSISFLSDPNTGIYRPAADSIGFVTNGQAKLVIDVDGQLEATATGSESLPTYTFLTDSDTGIYSPGADQLALSTGGTGRLFVDASGNVGIGTRLTVGGGTNSLGVCTFFNSHSASETGKILFRSNNNFNASLGIASIYASDAGTTNENRGNLIFATGFDAAPTERARIDSSGNVGIGTTPAHALDVAGGNISADNTDGRLIAFAASDTFSASVTTANYGLTRGASGTNTVGLSGYGGLSLYTLAHERLRIDSSGRLLVGTSSATTGSLLAVAGGDIIIRKDSGGDEVGVDTYKYRLATQSGVLAEVFATSEGSGGASGRGGALKFFTKGDNQGSTTERMRIDSSGNSTFYGPIYTAPSSTTAGIYGPDEVLGIGNNTEFQLLRTRNGAGIWGFKGPSNNEGSLIFKTHSTQYSPTERMRIDSSGRVLVNTSNAINGGGVLQVVGNSGVQAGQILMRHPDASSGQFWQIGPDNGNNNFVVYNHAAQGLYITNGQSSWTSSSDERLKTDLVNIEDGLAKVGALRAVTGRLKTDPEGTSKSFLIAQDVLSVFPEPVDTQNPDKLGLAYTEMIPLLVAALKESKERIETLEAKVAALEAA